MRKVRVNRETDALVIVDLQRDFCSGGALAVPDGDKIIQVVNYAIKFFSTVFATKDSHPEAHCSFFDCGGMWPPHCVEGTAGHEFHSELSDAGVTDTFYKGRHPDKDDYSGFAGFSRSSHCRLEYALEGTGAKRIFVAGLATEYCVKATVLDGLKQGFEIVVISDAIRAVNMNPDDGEKAIKEMKDAGAIFISSDKLVCSS